MRKEGAREEIIREVDNREKSEKRLQIIVPKGKLGNIYISPKNPSKYFLVST